MNELINNAQQLAITYGMNILFAILIYLFGKWTARIVKNVIIKVMKRSDVDPLLITFSSNLAYAAMIAFVVIAALNQLGIATTSFIAILGAAGLAIGLEFQGSLS